MSYSRRREPTVTKFVNKNETIVFAEKGEKIMYDGEGNILDLDVIYRNDQMNYYAILLKCGHTYDGCFVPVLFSFKGTKKDFVIQSAMHTPRVKTNSNPILGMKKISFLEYRFIKNINMKDGFLTSSDFNSSDLTERSVVNNENIDEVITGRDLDNSRIRFFADEFGDEYIFQKLLAPQLINGEIYQNDYVNLKDCLDEYFHKQAYTKGYLKNNLTILLSYYKIFGDNNRLGLRYENGIFSWPAVNGENLTVVLEDRHILDMNRAKKNSQKTDIESIEIDNSSNEKKNYISKFYEKFGENCSLDSQLEH